MNDDAVRLCLPDCVERIERDGKILMFNALMPAWVVTNQAGALLLSLCDGENTVDDIIGAYRDAGGAESDDQLRRFFGMARESGLFDLPPVEDRKITESRQRLNQVQLSISAGCNLHCRYCYATDRRESSHPRLPLDDYRRLVDDVLTLSPDASFTLTGGEPLLNPDCLDIARHIVGRDCGGVDLLTNGTLITEQNIDEIARLFYRVTISLDGSTPERHEFFRGKGSYARAERAIALLASRGVNYTLSMTVNRRNIDDVEPMAAKYGSLLNFAPLFPAGSANEGEDISITGKEYYEALREAHGVNPLSYCESLLDESLHCRRCKCAIGGAEVSVSPTGDVYPCQLLHYPEFLIGNVHDRPLTELIADSPVTERCARLTVDNIEGCRDCFLRYVCGGACRARAWHECRDIAVNGSFCEYEREAFIDGILSIYSYNLM